MDQNSNEGLAPEVGTFGLPNGTFQVPIGTNLGLGPRALRSG